MVAKWAPLKMKQDNNFTPGRISWIFFNHKHIVTALKDKPKGWFSRIAGGFFNDSTDSSFGIKGGVGVKVDTIDNDPVNEGK
jgi:hypothetical protein